MSEFSQAIEATKKQCGPEVESGGLIYNVDSMGKTTEKVLKDASTWKDTFKSRAESGADAINARLKQWGQNACSQIVDAMSMVHARGKIEFPQAQAKETVSKTVTAQAPKSQGLNNVAMYAQGASRIDRQMREAGL